MSVNFLALGFVLIPNIGSWILSVKSRDDIKNWYQTLKKPSLTPPDWVFFPVWTFIYSSIGYASYLIYKDGTDIFIPMVFYISNLIVNYAWSIIFFTNHQIQLAFYEINLITLTAVLCCITFYSINNLAGLLFVPYILWGSFATFISYDIYRLNTPKISY